MIKKFESRNVDFWVGVKQDEIMPIYRDYWDTFTREVFEPGRRREIVTLVDEGPKADRKRSET